MILRHQDLKIGKNIYCPREDVYGEITEINYQYGEPINCVIKNYDGCWAVLAVDNVDYTITELN